MPDDVLTQAQTPTEALIERIVRRMPGCAMPDCLACKSNREDAARFVSDAMALAYREAARRARNWTGLDLFVRELEALATALEEGTPA